MQAEKQDSSFGGTDQALPRLAVYRILDALTSAASPVAVKQSISQTVSESPELDVRNDSRIRASDETSGVLQHVQGAVHGGTAVQNPTVLQSCRGDEDLAAVLACAIGMLLRGSLGAVAAAGQAENPALSRRLVMGCARAALMCKGTVAANVGAAIWEVGR